jgi:hypothetical protein
MTALEKICSIFGRIQKDNVKVREAFEAANKPGGPG